MAMELIILGIGPINGGLASRATMSCETCCRGGWGGSGPPVKSAICHSAVVRNGGGSWHGWSAQDGDDWPLGFRVALVVGGLVLVCV